MAPSREKLLSDTATVIVAAIPLLASGGAGAALAAISAAAPSLVSLFTQFLPQKKNEVSDLRWTILLGAYGLSLAKLFHEVEFRRTPKNPELQTLVNSLLNRALILVEQNKIEVTSDMLFAPLKVPFLRDASRRIHRELEIFGPKKSTSECQNLFEKLIFRSLEELREQKDADFRRVESQMHGPFVEAQKRRRALSRHNEGIIRGFALAPIFGQEDSGITLNDIYVRQRCIWNTKLLNENEGAETRTHSVYQGFFHDEKNPGKWIYPLHVDDLHSTIDQWMKSGDNSDSLRFVAGGPGSGKSTFAKALAVEVIDDAKFDVLFIPLQEIEPTGTFRQRIENLFQARTDLGLDTTSNPLDWLGQRDSDGSPPSKPLLLICDGLDEIAPPESAEATAVTTHFVQELRGWLDQRNSGGFFACALVLGRTTAAQEVFKKASVNPEALLRVGGLLPLGEGADWVHAEDTASISDPHDLAPIDQRKIFWENWSKVNGSLFDVVPEALQGQTRASNALRELTAEPLLLYLLIWTGYLDEHWEDAARNRNLVYEEIFKQIFARKWGSAKPANLRTNSVGGGHTGTAEMGFEQFLLLQESLGLAAWPSGGRTVSLDSFKSILELHVGPEVHDDLPEDTAELLKSVALQSYTRSVGGERAGYEFVHKSLGEYLIARGIVTRVLKSTEKLDEKSVERKCQRAALELGQLTGLGPLTGEIHRFLGDELKLRVRSIPSAKAHLARFSKLTNLIVNHGVPLHQDNKLIDRHNSFSKLELFEKRAVNCYWAVLQAICSIAFPYTSWDPSDTSSTEAGVLKIEFENELGFMRLYKKLSSYDILQESGRVPTLNYLDLSGQHLNEHIFDLAQWDDFDDDLPGTQSRIRMMWVDFSLCEMFGSRFWGFDLTGSIFHNAGMSRASFETCVLSHAKYENTSLSTVRFANCVGAQTSFAGCDFLGASFRSCNLGGVDFSGSQSIRNTRRKQYLGPLSIDSCGFSGSNFSGTVLSSAIFLRSDLSDADFTSSDINGSYFVNCSQDGIIGDNETLEKIQQASASYDNFNRRDDTGFFTTIQFDHQALLIWRSENVTEFEDDDEVDNDVS